MNASIAIASMLLNIATQYTPGTVHRTEPKHETCQSQREEDIKGGGNGKSIGILDWSGAGVLE